jgi:hypothetical protein
MAAPIWDQIADLILARVKAGTYTPTYQIGEVFRPNQRWKRPQPEAFSCYVAIEDFNPGSNPEVNNTQPQDLVYKVGVYVMMPEDDLTPLDSIACYIISDLAKAITTPTDSWQTWSNLAANSHWQPFIEHHEDMSIVVAGVRITVQTRVSETDPYTSAV